MQGHYLFDQYCFSLPVGLLVIKIYNMQQLPKHSLLEGACQICMHHSLQ